MTKTVLVTATLSTLEDLVYFDFFCTALNTQGYRINAFVDFHGDFARDLRICFDQYNINKKEHFEQLFSHQDIIVSAAYFQPFSPQHALTSKAMTDKIKPLISPVTKAVTLWVNLGSPLEIFLKGKAIDFAKTNMFKHFCLQIFREKPLVDFTANKHTHYIGVNPAQNSMGLIIKSLPNVNPVNRDISCDKTSDYEKLLTHLIGDKSLDNYQLTHSFNPIICQEFEKILEFILLCIFLNKHTGKIIDIYLLPGVAEKIDFSEKNSVHVSKLLLDLSYAFISPQTIEEIPRVKIRIFRDFRLDENQLMGLVNMTTPTDMFLVDERNNFGQLCQAQGLPFFYDQDDACSTELVTLSTQKQYHQLAWFFQFSSEFAAREFTTFRELKQNSSGKNEWLQNFTQDFDRQFKSLAATELNQDIEQRPVIHNICLRSILMAQVILKGKIRSQWHSIQSHLEKNLNVGVNFPNKILKIAKQKKEFLQKKATKPSSSSYTLLIFGASAAFVAVATLAYKFLSISSSPKSSASNTGPKL